MFLQSSITTIEISHYFFILLFAKRKKEDEIEGDSGGDSVLIVEGVGAWQLLFDFGDTRLEKAFSQCWLNGFCLEGCVFV